MKLDKFLKDLPSLYLDLGLQKTIDALCSVFIKSKKAHCYYQDGYVVLADPKTKELGIIPLYPESVVKSSYYIDENHIGFNTKIEYEPHYSTGILLQFSYNEVSKLLIEISAKEKERDPLYSNKLLEVEKEVAKKGDKKVSRHDELFHTIAYLLSTCGVRDRVFLKYGKEWGELNLTTKTYDKQMESWKTNLIYDPSEIMCMRPELLKEFATGQHVHLVELYEAVQNYLNKKISVESFMRALTPDVIPYWNLMEIDWKRIMRLVSTKNDDFAAVIHKSVQFLKTTEREAARIKAASN